MELYQGPAITRELCDAWGEQIEILNLSFKISYKPLRMKNITKAGQRIGAVHGECILLFKNTPEIM